MDSALSAHFDAVFTGQQIMAIIRGRPPAETVAVATRAWDLGIRLVEVPIETPIAVPSLRAAVAAGRERGRDVGAGTVITVDQVQDVVKAGATFTVAPGLDADVAAACAAARLPHLPGIATPSEIQHARRLGLTWLKAFPAAALGTGWFTAMEGPFPGLRLVATGGMTARNAPAFLDAGAAVVAVGSALEDPEQLELLAELLH